MRENKQKNIRMLKTAKGQIEGIIKMLEEERYCVDISNQIMATTSILKTVNKNILTDHLSTCVLVESSMQEKEGKIQEIAHIIAKLSK